MRLNVVGAWRTKRDQELDSADQIMVDRYATSVEISKSLWSSASSVYIATGAFFPDGLAAAALASRDGAPLLLVKGGIVPDVVLNELRRLKPQRIVIIGGPAAVPDGTRDALLYY